MKAALVLLFLFFVLNIRTVNGYYAYSYKTEDKKPSVFELPCDKLKHVELMADFKQGNIILTINGNRYKYSVDAVQEWEKTVELAKILAKFREANTLIWKFHKDKEDELVFNYHKRIIPDEHRTIPQQEGAFGYCDGHMYAGLLEIDNKLIFQFDELSKQDLNNLELYISTDKPDKVRKGSPITYRLNVKNETDLGEILFSPNEATLTIDQDRFDGKIERCKIWKK